MSQLELTLQEAEEALFSIKDPDESLDRWFKIGRSLAATYGDSAKDMFERWSNTGSPTHPEKFNAHWKSFLNTRDFGIGSLIYEAKRDGWKRSYEKLSDDEITKRKIEIELRKKQAAEKKVKQEQEQLVVASKLEKKFLSLPKISKQKPTQYMLTKQMSDLSDYIDARLCKNIFGKDCVAWPFYEKLFNKGQFWGYEKINDKRSANEHNKFTEEGSKPGLGFITFGNDCDHGRKRIFVVGGLADAYACHVSTGEIVVTTVGELQIIKLAKRLKAEHPEYQVIIAPDQDKTGNQIVGQYDGFWSLPSKQVDWSDVYINEGKSAVKEQLLNIRGFEEVESNSRYLQACIRKGLNFFVSNMGTGKTTNVKTFVQENPTLRTLIISHRRELAKSLRNDINNDDVRVEYYEDLVIKNPGYGIDANAALREANILVCSVDSLWRLAGASWDVVFVDEVEQNLTQYFSSTCTHGEHCLNYLTFALNNSSYQILADAHLGELTESFCSHIGLHSGVKFKNNYQVGLGKKLFVYESKNHLNEVLTQELLNKGKRFVYCNTKNEVKAIAAALELEKERKLYSGKVLVVHSDSVSDKKDDSVAKALREINEVVPTLDVIIASPTLGTGFDIKSSAHQFEKTFGFLSSRIGTAEEGHQGLNRARDVQEFHVYIDPTERSEPTKADYIFDTLIEGVSNETMKSLSIDPSSGEFTHKNSTYEWLFCQVKAHQNKSRNSYKQRFLDIAKKDGYEIIEVSKDDMKAKFGQDSRKSGKARNNRELIKDIGDTKVVTGDEYHAMMNNSEDYTPIQIAKSKVAHDLNLMDASEEELDNLFPMAKEVYEEFAEEGENAHLNNVDAIVPFPESVMDAVTNSLTFLNEKNHYVEGIKKLAWVRLDKSIAKALDNKDVEHAESRVSWRNIFVRRNHRLKLLKLAGLNSDLIYNGKSWSKEELIPELKPWLSRQDVKDRLYMFSNITVTEKTLEDPCKWLNAQLKKLGVPVTSIKDRKSVPGKVINRYFINEDELTAVKSLVDMRVRGIEASMQQDEDYVGSYSEELIQKEVSSFIALINAGEVDHTFEDKYKHLDKVCRINGATELQEALSQAFAQISINHQTQKETPVKSDPHDPSVIYKTIEPCGSLPDQIIPPVLTEEGKEVQTAFSLPATPTLNDKERCVVAKVAELAVSKYNLAKDAVIKAMAEAGWFCFTQEEEVEAWAGTINDILADGV